MLRSTGRTIASTVAILLLSSAAHAWGPNAPLPCPDHEPEGAGSAAVAPIAAPIAKSATRPEKAAQSGHLSADERRVVGWLVGEIHRLEGSKDSTVDFTAEDVERETGVDVRRIDADEVREAVRDALRTETPPPAAQPEDASHPAPAAPPMGSDPESSSGGPGQG
jgi:hypothetical protein